MSLLFCFSEIGVKAPYTQRQAAWRLTHIFCAWGYTAYSREDVGDTILSVSLGPFFYLLFMTVAAEAIYLFSEAFAVWYFT